MKATHGLSAAQLYSDETAAFDGSAYVDHLDGADFGRPFFDAPALPRAPHLVAVPTPRLRRSYRADRAQALEEIERRDVQRDPVVLLERDDAFGPLEKVTRRSGLR